MIAKSLPQLPRITKGNPTETSTDDVATTIRDATSHDLVFAVVGHAGAGVTHVANSLLEELRAKEHVAYLVKMSTLISTAAEKLDREQWASTSVQDRFERACALQKAGNWLRETNGAAFTAGLAVRDMHERRNHPERRDKHIALVIDSLKNKNEVDALRKVYGRSFYLISVICSPEIRKRRLTLKYKDSSGEVRENARMKIEAFANRDEHEDYPFGQQVRKTIQLGDFFVNNDATSLGNGEDPMNKALARFLELVLGTSIVRPTPDERGMYAAWSASLRSSCLSRQVGAAILDEKNQIIATGTNDAPKYAGGLYEEGDDVDYRCFKYPKPNEGEQKGFCRNDQTKRTIYEEIVNRLRSANVLAENVNDTQVRHAIEATPIADLIEFSRAVHAEMDALISLARTGNASASGGTLYCRTYPCHSCARHIVAAGILDVVYIEPYTKSRASTLHDDVIKETTERPGENAQHVHFRLFTGVAPRRFSSLFEKRDEIKDREGRLHLPVDINALHQDPVFTKSHTDFESSIATRVTEIEGRTS